MRAVHSTKSVSYRVFVAMLMKVMILLPSSSRALANL